MAKNIKTLKVNVKNIKKCLDDGPNINLNPFVSKLIDKTKNDDSFNKFLSLVIKHNLLIFEKKNEWVFKEKQYIENQIDKSIAMLFNDHILNTNTLLSCDNYNLIDIKTTLDKLHFNIKKKIGDFDELKKLLELIDFNITTKVKIKKIINNDIYIEEFTN